MKTSSLKDSRKDYYSKNREAIRQKSAKYYADNRERVLERMAERHRLNPIPARERAKSFAESNPEKVSGYQKSWKERNPEKRKLYTRNSRIRAYGIEPNEYYEMLEKQGQGCAICKSGPTYRAMNIDHDHATGKVRGLLCDSCNMSLGHIEREGFLEKAMEYLAKYK